ncbi:peroxynitrite isomerase THAP4-like [Anabrus simplex]|uniref:peroxynitrite isomerase THAP4-like n=1 Tax=Anabrus simplex TaxID=316456 RepID=UPI0035A39C1C
MYFIMVGCSAPNCNNVSSAGYRLFRFPSENSRRAIWLQNCRRDRWKPTSTSRLCKVHFEDNQWEHKRADGWKKLKPNAIPSLFNVPNPPRRLLSARKSQYKKTSQDENKHSEGNVSEQQLQNEEGCSSNSEAFGPSTSSTIAELQEEINSLRSELHKKNVLMKTFLNDEQISALEHMPSP